MSETNIGRATARETLDELLETAAGYYRHQMGDALDMSIQEIYDRIKAGEPEPDWERQPLMASYYQTRKVTHDRGGRVENGD